MPSNNTKFNLSYFGYLNIDTYGSITKNALNSNDTTLLQTPQTIQLDFSKNEYLVLGDYFLFDSITSYKIDSNAKVIENNTYKSFMKNAYISKVAMDVFNLPYLYCLYGDTQANNIPQIN